MFYNFAPGGVTCASKTTEKKDKGFLWIFHGKTTREKSTCGANIRFSCFLRQNPDG
jgi:hypothetical protein